MLGCINMTKLIDVSVVAVLGLASSYSYLDGVPFKISRTFRPSPQVSHPFLSFCDTFVGVAFQFLVS